MARPLRIEFAGALYHVTSRGDRREDIYDDDLDRQAFLNVLGNAVDRFNWICHAYCLMSNHYHLLIETPDANLSQGMRQLNGVFTQKSNRRHGRSGHLFQGRFKAILVDRDAYLLELCRYVVLNPVRAGMVKLPEQWPWSSYRSTMGLDAPVSFLNTETLLSLFGGRRSLARKRYETFVADGVTKASIWSELRQQIYLGDERFVARMQTEVDLGDRPLTVPIAQRRPPAPSLEELVGTHTDRNTAIVAAYRTGAYSYQQIANFFGIHLSTVGRAVRKALDKNAAQQWKT
ncbi:MAG: transposase [Gammaproteobacteria bacterium]|nr:transposase [Gammaproteobacteria bacterium]MCP5136612.1 transposase [Gammaproteobacteria bacterium]